ncbi:Lipopolysaccharide export system protein LptA [BD1-7 clade bacterium]|uniref:Lipopolysaccharide export system protein LptA n=1 Tax=BD1-7 clade bacterium TaxID=2029982 RepID=A0A5S9MW06_9GAMM|nr:Lipopolysaccharide export system protein LptA [BD1-7 clade bacterium]
MTRRKPRKKTSPKHTVSRIGLLLAFFAINTVQAMPSDREQPIRITADSATHSEKTGITVYLGDVYLEQGTLKLQGEKVTIHSTPSGEVTYAEAVGQPAKLQQKPATDKETMYGEADEIHYKIAGETITFVDNAYLKQGKSEMKGDHIEYQSQAQMFKARSSKDASNGKPKRVEIVLPPQSQLRKTGSK